MSPFLQKTIHHTRWTALAALAVGIAACGSSGDTGNTAPSKPATVSVKQVGGVGAVLVDKNGRALYTPDQETNGKIRCSVGCTSIWAPLKPGANAPTAASSLTGKLSTTQRPDGGSQVTYSGKPLYTFSQDPGPGKVTGNGAQDSFGGTSFTWHAVTATGTSSGQSRGGGYGY